MRPWASVKAKWHGFFERKKERERERGRKEGEKMRMMRGKNFSIQFSLSPLPFLITSGNFWRILHHFLNFYFSLSLYVFTFVNTKLLVAYPHINRHKQLHPHQMQLWSGSQLSYPLHILKFLTFLALVPAHKAKHHLFPFRIRLTFSLFLLTFYSYISNYSIVQRELKHVHLSNFYFSPPSSLYRGKEMANKCRYIRPRLSFSSFMSTLMFFVS